MTLLEDGTEFLVLAVPKIRPRGMGKVDGLPEEGLSQIYSWEIWQVFIQLGIRKVGLKDGPTVSCCKMLVESLVEDNPKVNIFDPLECRVKPQGPTTTRNCVGRVFTKKMGLSQQAPQVWIIRIQIPPTI